MGGGLGGVGGEEGLKGIVVVHTEIIRGPIPGPSTRVGNNHTRNGNGEPVVISLKEAKAIQPATPFKSLSTLSCCKVTLSRLCQCTSLKSVKNKTELTHAHEIHKI